MGLREARETHQEGTSWFYVARAPKCVLAEACSGGQLVSALLADFSAKHGSEGKVPSTRGTPAVSEQTLLGCLDSRWCKCWRRNGWCVKPWHYQHTQDVPGGTLHELRAGR